MRVISSVGGRRAKWATTLSCGSVCSAVINTGLSLIRKTGRFEGCQKATRDEGVSRVIQTNLCSITETTNAT